MKHYLKLIRIENLLMVAFMQLIVKYGFLNHIHFRDALGAQQSLIFWQSLSNFQYFLFVFATLFIMAGGYVINNIFDVETDTINKPQNVVVGSYISEKAAYNLYFILTCLGVGIGFYLSRVIAKPSFATIFVICAALLYIYSNGLKQIPILGNAVIAILASLSILNIGFFNILPAIYSGNEVFMKTLLSILTDYAIFAFFLHFAREIIKTVEDYEGDKAYEISTVATSFGIKTAKIIASLSLLILISYIVYFIIENLAHNLYAVGYFIIFIIAPLLYITIKLFSVNLKEDFTLLSKSLKLVMLTTILSLVVILISMLYA
jgi:4-hydroxybenzoate polyprenyltransferase